MVAPRRLRDDFDGRALPRNLAHYQTPLHVMGDSLTPCPNFRVQLCDDCLAAVRSIISARSYDVALRRAEKV